ncbi:MAG: hypothetical protein ABSH33_14520 [Steroidobacteraceae bacterium]|jgi:hypothetical protein
MAWTFNAPFDTLSDTPTVDKAETLWEKESLGGLTEDNNPIPVPVVWLVFLTVCTAFCVTFPLWGQRPTAALYAPYVNSMDKPQVLAAKDDVQAMQIIVAMNKGVGNNDAMLARHPVTMDDLRLLKDQILALEKRPGVDLRDYTVVGEKVLIANFEGNYRPDGTRIRQQPWWDKGYTIDLFYLSAFFLGVFLVVKRLPPTKWQPRHGDGH